MAWRGGVPFDQPLVDLELDEGEQILYVGRRHWIELAQTAFVFVLMFVLGGGLVVYRLVGGTFLKANVSEPGLDVVGVIQLFIAAILSYFWLRAEGQKKAKTKRPGPQFIWLYPVFIALLLLGFYFHYLGGRIFHIDPIDASGFDTLNTVLTIVAGIGLAAMIYFYVDWKDDFLVVTNSRVVYDDEQLFVRHVQQQILISDIQQVNMRADTYSAYWLGYGTVIIRSFSNKPLTFLYADKPKMLVDAIQGEVNKLRRAEGPELLRRLIEEQVYNNKSQPKPAPHVYVKPAKPPIPWLFKHNPEIEGDTIKWRPYWLVTIVQMLKPFGLFAGTSIVALFLGRSGVDAFWLWVLWGMITIFCAGWIFWIREEHEHDVYVLNRTGIIDVDARPFGPESSRRAPLSAIQDVSFDISFLESILGYGTVIIKTGGATGGDFTFNNVPNPRGVQATINDYLTDFKKGEKERQFQETLQVFRAYHQLQVEHREVVTPESLAQQIDERITANLPQVIEDRFQKQVSQIVGEHLGTQNRRQGRRDTRDAFFRRMRRRLLRGDQHET